MGSMGTTRAGPPLAYSLARLVCYAIASLVTLAATPPAGAQQLEQGVLAPGNAAVTGFSGVQSSSPRSGSSASRGADETVIDLNGPSLRIIDLQHMGGPPGAQVVRAAKPYTATAAQVGQVFGVAYDDASPLNVYVAASSVYGLPIVAPGPDGKPRHVRIGGPGATFMPGLWGGAEAGGGPGSIWKIDGATGKVSLFANVTLDGRPNSGPGLGGLAFDPTSRSLYVADRETGVIQRFDLSGKEHDRYRHGITGRRARGLRPWEFDPAKNLNVTSPQFDPASASTWNYAAPEGRVFGLGVFRGRLYYSVADGLQIWSIGLQHDGSFGTDPALELTVPPGSGPTEISKIIFDEQGWMILAERPAPTGAFDFEALTPEGLGRVLRYTSATTTQHAWQTVPDEYPVGFAGDLRNGNGGVDIGYRYDQNGDIDRTSCGGFVWVTGEQLRRSPDPSVAAKLGQSGPLLINGLQGSATQNIRQDDQPPLVSYFIRYGEDGVDPAARGHLGDITIARDCMPVPKPGGVPLPGTGDNSDGKRGGPRAGGVSPPGSPMPPGGGTGTPPGNNGPPGLCPPGQLRDTDSGPCHAGTCDRPDVRMGDRCCSPKDLLPGGACSSPAPTCPKGQIAVGPSNQCCSRNAVFTDATGAKACCPTGKLVNGRCNLPAPPGPPNCSAGSTNPNCCPNGSLSVGGSCCVSNQVTSTGICCPNGQSPGGPNNSQCHPNKVPVPPAPPGMCCPAGKTPASDGSCCDPNLLTTTGVCCPAGDPPDPNNRTNCPAQIQIFHKCPAGETWNGSTCVGSSASCPSDSRGTPPDCKCPPGTSGIPGSCTPEVKGKCPTDSTGKWPDCKCKRGTDGTPGSCAPVAVNKCPADSTGKWPNCHLKKGSGGTSGPRVPGKGHSPKHAAPKHSRVG